MKIFVTGATGKVGSRLVPYLLENGNEVYALVRDANRAQALKDNGAHLVVGDLQTADLTTSLVGMDAVIHAAAQFRGDTTEAQAKATNVDASVKLANEALNAGVKRFVYVSTNLVYGSIDPKSIITEETPTQPTDNLYPKSKIAAERALQELASHADLDLKIVRLGFVYGDGDQHLAEFMPFMSRWTPDAYVSLIHHQDVDQALMLAATSQNSTSQIYNATDDTPIKVVDLVKATHTTPSTEEVVAMGKWENATDNARIEKELGFKPVFPSYQDAAVKDVL